MEIQCPQGLVGSNPSDGVRADNRNGNILRLQRRYPSSILGRSILALERLTDPVPQKRGNVAKVPTKIKGSHLWGCVVVAIITGSNPVDESASLSNPILYFMKKFKYKLVFPINMSAKNFIEIGTVGRDRPQPIHQ